MITMWNSLEKHPITIFIVTRQGASACGSEGFGARGARDGRQPGRSESTAGDFDGNFQATCFSLLGIVRSWQCKHICRLSLTTSIHE